MENGLPTTLQEAVQFYGDVENCVQLMIRLRWPAGVTCPHCESKEVTRLLKATRPLWQCKACRKQFTPKVGTIMEDSPLGLDKWLMAIWMLTNCKNGVSSCEIARAIGVTQKTAWFLLHRIRYAMNNGTIEKMTGEVEADETFIGGREANKHEVKKLKKGRGAVGKAVVAGLLERGGGIRVKTVRNTSKETLGSNVRKHVKPGTKLYTDAAPAYQTLSDEYVHDFVDHAVEYVRGAVSTNGLENFWSLLKRTIKGTYVAVDVPHLDAYLDEQAFRYSFRGSNDAGRFMTVTVMGVGKRITYKQLISRSEP